MLLITISLFILSITSTDTLETESYCKEKTPFTIVQYERNFLALFKGTDDPRLKQLNITKDFKRDPLNDRTDIVKDTLKDTSYTTLEDRLPDAGIYPSHTVILVQAREMTLHIDDNICLTPGPEVCPSGQGANKVISKTR